MLANGTAMFLLIPEASNERILHPGKVLESDPAHFVAEFEEAIAPEIGMDVNVFAEVNGKFFQQGAAVVEIRQTEPKPVVAFDRVGEAVSAENRQLFRVSVANADIFATIGKESNCRVVDMNAAGFGAILKGDYAIGSVVSVNIEYEGQIVSTNARVQTVKCLPSGKLRYGFLTPQKNGKAGDAMRKISAAVQRTQLQRLAGAA